MGKIKKLLVGIYLIIGYISTIHAQSISLNTPGLDEYLRRKQLLGEISGYSSFAIRPLYPVEAFDRSSAFDLDSTF